MSVFRHVCSLTAGLFAGYATQVHLAPPSQLIAVGVVPLCSAVNEKNVESIAALPGSVVVGRASSEEIQGYVMDDYESFLKYLRNNGNRLQTAEDFVDAISLIKKPNGTSDKLFAQLLALPGISSKSNISEFLKNYCRNPGAGVMFAQLQMMHLKSFPIAIQTYVALDIFRMPESAAKQELWTGLQDNTTLSDRQLLSFLHMDRGQRLQLLQAQLTRNDPLFDQSLLMACRAGENISALEQFIVLQKEAISQSAWEAASKELSMTKKRFQNTNGE